MNAKAKLISPVDGRVYAERLYATPAAIATALESAQRAARSWRLTSINERAEYCTAVVEAVIGMSDAIVPELAWQMGRPVRYGAGEMRGFAERARHMISIAPEALASIEPQRVDGYRRYIKREPLGTVFAIAPWNYPYLTAVNVVIPALMAGNSVILKHATQTLLVGERLLQACQLAGLPDGVFQNLVLDHAQAAAIIESGQIQHVHFTGSVAGGHEISRLAAKRFVGTGLELGGKDPAYVRADADLEHAVSNLVEGTFFNSGQSCCGIERIYVHEHQFRAFVEHFEALTYDYVLGNPLEPATTLGPLVNAKAAELVQAQIDGAVAQGARTLIDPTRFVAPAGAAYMRPQVLVDVNHRMALMREENFGPVVGIMAVAGDAEAVALMNDSQYGLTASIWTTDLGGAEAVGDQLETGTVFMNRCDYLDPALAWTGVKDTGRGASLSRVGYEALSRPKSFHLRQLS